MSIKVERRPTDYYDGYHDGYHAGYSRRRYIGGKDQSTKATTECIDRIRELLRASGDNSVNRYLISHELNKMMERL